MRKEKISSRDVTMRLQKIKMPACEWAPGKLPVMCICDAYVVMRTAAVIAKWVTKIKVRYGSIISWNT